MKHFTKRIAAAFLLLMPLCAAAQKSRLYTTESGLPNSRVNRITQDERGFIWVSTENGLASYDGREFMTFRHARDNDKALASDLVLTIFEDSRGTMWTATSAGLQIFSPELRTFTRVDLQDPASPASNQHISDVIETESGDHEIWVATSQHGVYILDGETHALKPNRRQLLEISLPSPFVYSLFQDSRGWVWIAGETGGLSVVDGSTMLNKGISLAPDIHVRAFAEDPLSGNILLATMEGLYIYDAGNGSMRRPSDKAARTCQACALLYGTAIQKAGDRIFLVGTETEGIKVYDMALDVFREPNLPPSSSDISKWKVHSLLEDNQGNIWVGAYQTGVLVIPRSMYGFEQTDVPGGSVTSMVRNPSDGSLWVGSDGGGILRIGKDGSRSTFNSHNSALTNDSVLALCFDKRGKLWVGTYLDGLFTYTPQTGFRHFRDDEALGSSNVVCLAYDTGSDLMYAGTFGSGMGIISALNEKVERRIVEDINKWVNAIFIDSTGTLWLGTYNGPVCYNPALGRLISYDMGDTAGKARVYCIEEASDGRIWMGTGEGVTVCDRSGLVAAVYSEADGLSDNGVMSIREAADGTVWISTSYGLNRFNPATGTFTRYYAYDGLQSNEFHFGASFGDEDGKLCFGGTGGFTAFYPQIANQKPHPVPPLYFSRLTLLGSETTNNPSRVELPSKKNSFSLEFSVLEYTNPMRVRYAYRLDRFDGDWNYLPPRQNTISYTNLPGGRYTLHVKAYFDGAPDQSSISSIPIRVAWPWFLSAWAFLGYLVIILAGLWLLWHLVNRRRIHAREREASEIKDLKLKMFTNISHEIRTPLTLIMSPLKQMRETEQDPALKGKYNLMYRNSLRIMRLVNQLMDMRKVDEGQMRLHFLETDIVYFIRDIMQSFDNLAVSRNIDLTLESPSEVLNLWIDQGNFDKIIFNLVSNAFKHSPDGGKVTISISAPEKNRGALAPEVASLVRISVSNRGSHIEEAYLDKVFERFFQSDVLDAKMGSGVGLSLTRMLVELHHGTISAANTEDGVAFTMLMPLGCAHLTEEEMSKTSHHKDLYIKTPIADDVSRSTEDMAFVPNAAQSGKMVKSKRSIVIVDDDPDLRDYLLDVLKSRYNVKTFASGPDAWADISAAQPDVVVTDLVMSGMDGLELCRKIKQHPVTNHIPVIMLTSSSDESSQLQSTDSGADRFLSKPVSVELLQSTLAQVISMRETIRGKFSNENRFDYTEVKMPSYGDRFMDKVTEVVKRNLDNPEFGVEQLSAEVGMSRVHMNRKLKEELGISPSSLIKSTRMKQAAYLLVNDKVNISEVAYRVGFSTPSYFSNSFHSYFGLTPKEFVAKYSDPANKEKLEKLFA